MLYCLLCQTYTLQAKPLCPECTTTITAVPFASMAFLSGLSVRSLYPYHGALRKLCLRIKVQSEARALDTLLGLALNHPSTAKALSEVEVITPVPSSLWGRLRGRFDIAGILAGRLSKETGIPLQYLPPRAYWQRLRKRSMVREEALPEVSSRASDEKKRRLIVDDITTTGLSLFQTGRWFLLDDIRYFTLFRTEVAASDPSLRSG